MKSALFPQLLIVSCALLLAACGGGSGSDGKDTTRYEISTDSGAGGAINPNAATIATRDTASFTLAPDDGYTIASVSGCGGSLSDTTYTTGPIDGDCMITATFVASSADTVTYEVNAAAGSGGNITPAFLSIQEGHSAAFTITPDPGHAIASVTGCNGTLSDATYTTGAITADCEVQASFAAIGAKAPTVSAGPDQSVEENTPVTLDCTASDTDGTIQSYGWSQVSGTTVTIDNADGVSMNFDAPDIDATEVLVFEILVTDNDGLTASDKVAVTVRHLSPVAVVAANGLPAAGFPDGFVYWSLSQPSIGSSGHVAFTGVADVSVQSTDENTNALWAGLPSDLKLVIQEDDTLPGLPTNILFSNSSHTPPIVNGRGEVAQHIGLKGAVTTYNDEALAVYADDMLQIVIREGDAAPGLPTGYTIRGLGGTYAFTQLEFSNAGLVFIASTNNTATNRPITGMWFWDFNTFTLVAAFDAEADVLLTEESPAIFAEDCQFHFLLTAHDAKFNDEGEIAFSAGLFNDSGENCPDAHTLLKWKDSQFTAVLSNDDPVPGLAGYRFIYSGGLFNWINLEADGDIGLVTMIRNDSGSRLLNWVVKDNGEHEFISMTGETLPDDANATIAGFNYEAPMADDQGNYLVRTMTAESREIYLLKGPSIELPYSTVDEIGART